MRLVLFIEFPGGESRTAQKSYSENLICSARIGEIRSLIKWKMGAQQGRYLYFSVPGVFQRLPHSLVE